MISQKNVTCFAERKSSVRRATSHKPLILFVIKWHENGAEYALGCTGNNVLWNENEAMK